MAENVKVTNFGDWAKESVVVDLLRQAKLGNEILKRYVDATLGPEQLRAIEKQTSVTEEGLDNIADATNTKPVVAAVNKTNTTMDIMKRELKDAFSSIGDQLSTADPRSMFSSFSNNLRYTSRYLDETAGTLGAFVKGLAKGVAVLSISYNRLMDLTDAYTASYAAGVRFSGGIDGLNKAVGESGMTVQEFTGLMNKYSQSFAVLGGDRVVKLNKRFREITNSGSDLMMTQAESQDALLMYADILRSTGQLNRMTTNQVALGGKEFLESINDLSAVSGRSREEILRSTRDAIAQPSFQAFLTGLDDVAKANLEKGVASLAAFGADIQNEYKDMLVAAGTGGVAAMFRTNTNLMQLANQTGQIPKLMKIIELAQAGQDTTSAMKEFYEGMKASNLVQSGQLNILAQFNPMYAGMRDEFGKLGAATNSLADLNKQAAERGFESVEAMRKYDDERSKTMLAADAEMKQAMTALNAAFNDLIIHVIYPVLVPALKTMATVVNFVTSPLQKLGDMLHSLNDMLSGIIGETGAGLVTSGLGLAGAGLGYKYGKAGLGKGMDMFRAMRGGAVGGMGLPEGPSLAGFDMPGIERASKAGKLISPLVDSMKGLGAGFGKMIQSVLTGIAMGIKAFSGTLAPALQLAGSIVVIGGAVDLIVAGFGAAMMVVGKGIEFVGNGLQKFNDIDGINLGEVGKGMVLLGAGMAAMGVGEVVSAWGSIVDGVMSWWKADVKSKLLEYAGIGEPLSRAGEGLNSFASSFRKAVDLLNNATLSDSVGSTFDQIKGFLNTDMSGFFGGAPAIIDQVNMLANSIGNLAEKTGEFKTATAGATATMTTPVIAADDLQKRTLSFYDDQKQSNASMISLLQNANNMLQTINDTISDQTTDLSRAYRDAGRVF